MSTRSHEDILDVLTISVNNLKWDISGTHHNWFDLHRCTDEELENFWPMEETDAKHFESAYRETILCFDHTDLELYGNINTMEASILTVHVDIKP